MEIGSDEGDNRYDLEAMAEISLIVLILSASETWDKFKIWGRYELLPVAHVKGEAPINVHRAEEAYSYHKSLMLRTGDNIIQYSSATTSSYIQK